MKKIFLIPIALLTLISCQEKEIEKKAFVEDELIFIVEMTVNDKTAEEVEVFSKFYSQEVAKVEPTSLGFGFFKSEDKVILIERYKNSDALITHAANVAEGGILEKQFSAFMEHFVIEKIYVHGDPSLKLIESMEAFQLPTIYRKTLGKFSRS